jgi:voltage-gated potassium channel
VGKLKTTVFQIFDEGDAAGHPLNKPLGFGIMALIILSVIAVILESDDGLAERFHGAFFAFEVFAVSVFSLEYLSRFWTADMKYAQVSVWKARVTYILTPMAIIDFLAIAPFYFELALAIYGVHKIADTRILRILRLMRLLRLFKLNRYNDSMKLIGNVMREEKEKLVITIFMVFILLILSAALIFSVEHEEQPEAFPNIFTSLWWSVATLTTVGYGDVYPITPSGKVLAGVIALLGVGLVALPTGILASAFVSHLNSAKEQKEEKAEEDACCPHCGKKL